MTEKIPFKDFQKVEMRVGTIKSAKQHPNADKLFVLEVDLGESEPRTIVSGLQGYYTPEDLTGKQAIFATNLEPAKLRGIESNGMILAACTDNHEQVVILNPEKPIKEGTKIS